MKLIQGILDIVGTIGWVITFTTPVTILLLESMEIQIEAILHLLIPAAQAVFGIALLAMSWLLENFLKLPASH